MVDENIRLLLIDDDRDDFTLVKSYLFKAGGLAHELDWASTYAGGLKNLGEGSYDLCLVDYFLGAKTGIELIAEARREGIDTPFIMLTGVGDRSIDMAAISAGASDYLNKDHLNPEFIERSVRHALTHFRDTKEIRKLSANLEAIFSSVSDPIITVDTDLNIIELNRGAEEFCGLKRAESIGKSFEDLVPGSKYLQRSLRETVARNIKIEARRVEFTGSNNRERVVSTSCSPLRNSLDTLSGAVLVIRDLTRLDRLERDLATRSEYHNIVGSSAGIQEVFSLIERVADVDTTMLVTGESGTGKELVANAIHYKGARAKGPLIKVNCTALTDSLLDSELFGHVKGAFTGAIRDRIGNFQAADGGTIFLDEVGEMSPAMQIKLLRVLQEREVVPVGDVNPIKVDVRVIAATNRKLAALVRDGRFREDLFYRLKVVEIIIPPLRERRSDISMLTNHFIRKFNDQFKRNVQKLSPEAESIFLNSDWPGNVRELEHAIEHGVVLCTTDTLTVECLPPELREGQDKDTVKVTLDREVIIEALREACGNKARAARLLGTSRPTIYKKIKEFGIRNQEGVR